MTLRKNKTHNERGLIAVLAGFTMFFVVALGIAIAEMGLNVVHVFEAHNAAEAIAMTEGMVVLSMPSPWDSAQVPPNLIVTTNSRSVENLPAFNFVPVPSQSNGPATPADAPGIAGSAVTGPLQNFGTMLRQPTTVGGSASSAVYQFQLNKLVPVLSRIVLVLDYSKSMRLSFANSQGTAGLTAVRQAAYLAITSPTLSNRVNWGLVEFAGQVDPNPVHPLNVGLTQPYQPLTAGQIAQQQTLIEQHLAYQTGSGMTDMADAVDQARGLLDQMGAQGDSNPDLGKGIILLISDGEPDYVPGNLDDSVASYATRVAEAEDNVRAAVTKAWGSGYQTLTMTVWTDPASLPPDSLTGFMADLAGNSDGKKQNEPQNAFVAYKPEDIQTWLSTINPATHCLSQSKMDISGSPWMNIPGAADNIYGYYVAGGVPRYQETATVRSHDPNNMDPPMVNNQWTNGAKEFWWDNKNQLVELNVTLCTQYLREQAMNPPPEFRLRWGSPRLYATQKLKTGG